MATTGKIVPVSGTTLDAQFREEELPAIYNALHVEIERDGSKSILWCEVQQHLGGGKVRFTLPTAMPDPPDSWGYVS